MYVYVYVYIIIFFLPLTCVDVSKLWFSDGLQPKQLWFQTKVGVVEMRSYDDSQSGRSLLLFISAVQPLSERCGERGGVELKYILGRSLNSCSSQERQCA